MRKVKLFQVRLSSTQKRQLDNMSKQLRRTKSDIVRDLITVAIENYTKTGEIK